MTEHAFDARRIDQLAPQQRAGTPAEVASLVAYLMSDAASYDSGQVISVVIGSRLHSIAAIPRARYRANRIANFWIGWAAGYRIADSQCGFRVYPAWLFQSARVRHNRRASFVFESEIVIEAARLG